MNGPEHYAESQAWLLETAPTRTGEDLAAAVAIAQVHATLALVAATVDAGAAMNVTWTEVTR